MNISRKDPGKLPVKYPTKRTINLAQRETDKQRIRMIAGGCALIVILCAIVVKFGVVDQFRRLEDAEHAYNTVHETLTEQNKELDTYSETEQEYHTYSRKWMNEDESVAVTVDREEVLDLMEDYMMSCGTVKRFLVEGDAVLANMSGMNLEQISAMFAQLQRQPIVASASLNIASTSSSADEVLEFSVSINLTDGEEAEEE